VTSGGRVTALHGMFISSVRAGAEELSEGAMFGAPEDLIGSTPRRRRTILDP
jgi:hypothetical protein